MSEGDPLDSPVLDTGGEPTEPRNWEAPASDFGDCWWADLIMWGAPLLALLIPALFLIWLMSLMPGW